MLSLALENHPGLELTDMERRRAGKSYTIDTLEELSADPERGEILLLIGADSLCQLHTWKRPHDLVKSSRIVTYPRKGQVPDPALLRPFWSEGEIARMLSSVIPDAPSFSGFFPLKSANAEKRRPERRLRICHGPNHGVYYHHHLYGTGETEKISAPSV